MQLFYSLFLILALFYLSLSNMIDIDSYGAQNKAGTSHRTFREGWQALLLWKFESSNRQLEQRGYWCVLFLLEEPQH